MDALENLGIVATGTAAAGLVARYGIQRFARLAEEGIDRSAEAIEGGIEQFFDKELARHQAELEANRVMSSRFHEERAKVVIELYQRFVQFERDMRALQTGPSGDGSTEEALQQARESGTDFRTYYLAHKIYFPPDTCDTVERVQDAMNHVFDGFQVGSSHSSRPEGRADVDRYLADWNDVAGDEVPELKDELEAHFRGLLGVDLDGDQLDDS